MIKGLDLNQIEHVELLSELAKVLSKIKHVEDPDAFEFLSGIRDQANRIMRDSIRWVESDGDL